MGQHMSRRGEPGRLRAAWGALLLELEGSRCTRELRGVDGEALGAENLFDVGHIEVGDAVLEQDLALRELSLETFGVPSWSERLAVSVLLMAGCASRRTSRAARVLRVALGGEQTSADCPVTDTEIQSSGGNSRRV